MRISKKAWRGIENLFVIMFIIIFWLSLFAIILYNHTVYQEEFINELIYNGR